MDTQMVSQILNQKKVAAREDMSLGELNHFPFSLFDSPALFICSRKRRFWR